LHTGHQNIRTYFSDTTAAKPTTKRNAQRHDSTEHLHSPYPLSSARHPPAILACKNTARYDFNRHTPVLSWAQQRQLSRSAFKHQAQHTHQQILPSFKHAPPVWVNCILYSNQYSSSRDIIATTASFSLLSSPSADVPVRPLAWSTLGFKTLCHLLIHCKIDRLGTSVAIAAQSLPPCVSAASFSLLSSSAVHLPARVVVGSILGSKKLCHLFQDCFFVRPGINAVIMAQSLPPCVSTASFNLLSSSAVHLPARAILGSMLETNEPCHLLEHCDFVRPGTKTAIAPHFLPPCVCTASVSLLSSSFVHVPAHPFAGSMVGTKTRYHRLLHWLCVRSGTSAATASQLVLYSLSHFFKGVFVIALFSFASSSFVQ
jgi:hypothetical protein